MSFRNDFSPGFKIPQTAMYFKEEIINELISLPECNPDMKGLLNTLVSANIESFKLIETEQGLSNEGQKLTGYKLLVKVRLKEKIMYIAESAAQPIYAMHQEDIINMFVILPQQMNGVDVCKMVKTRKIIVTPYVECVEARMLDCRNIHKCVMLLVDVTASGNGNGNGNGGD